MFARLMAAAALLIALSTPAIAQNQIDTTGKTPPLASAPIAGKWLWTIAGYNMDIPLSLTRYGAANTTTAARTEALRVYRQILVDRGLTKAAVDAAVTKAGSALKLRALAGEDSAWYQMEFSADAYVLIVVNKVPL